MNSMCEEFVQGVLDIDSGFNPENLFLGEGLKQLLPDFSNEQISDIFGALSMFFGSGVKIFENSGDLPIDVFLMEMVTTCAQLCKHYKEK